MRFSIVVAIFTTLLICDVSPAGAQQTAAPTPTSDSVAKESRSPSAGQVRPSSRSGLGIWMGHSFLPGSVLGSLQEGQVGLLGVRFSRLLIPTSEQVASGYDGATLTYTADLVPLAHVGIPVESRPDDLYLGRPAQTSDLSTNGTGAYPVGLRVSFRSERGIKPFLAGHAGVLYFFEHIPDDRGRKTNFAVGLGGGVALSFAAGTDVIIGYRYHHLSNGFRGSINPGLDANVLYLGLGTSL